MESQFNKFTEKAYKAYLIKLLKYYNVINFEDALERKYSGAILRHDLDFSVHRALKIAEIENKLNIKSTYFLHLHSEFYNIFEKEIFEIINKILKLNHELGLHFDPNFYGANNINSYDDLESKVNYESDLLRNLFNYQIKVFSFHNTDIGANWLKYDKNKISGLINTYGVYFKKKFKYISDSNGYWRFDNLDDFLEKKFKNIQILTHPVWWTKKEMSPRKKIDLVINGRKQSNVKKYDGYFVSNKERINVK